MNLTFAESLTEPDTVQCTAIGGESPELFNLTLWRNDEVLAQVSGDHLTYTTSPGLYGTYTCGVDGVQNSSVLQERGKYQKVSVIKISGIHCTCSEVSIAIECCQYYGVPPIKGITLCMYVAMPLAFTCFLAL